MKAIIEGEKEVEINDLSMSGEIFNMPLKHLGHSDAKEKRKSKRKRNNKKSKKLPGDYQSDYLYLEE